MKIRKFLVATLVAILFSSLLTGCFFFSEIQPNEVGVVVNGGEITRCLEPGVHSDSGFYSDLVRIDRSAFTFQVADPEVATADNQLVGIAITVQAGRDGSCEARKRLLTNWTSLVDNDNLIKVVQATTREAIKNGTRKFDLNQLLDDRNQLSLAISSALQEDASKYGVEIINITIENIEIDEKYSQQLEQKALYRVQTEAELEKQKLINQTAANNRLEQEQRATVLEQQLLAEEKQTAVQVEIATREGKEIAARNQVYLENEPAYKLEIMRLLEKVVGNNWVFVDPNTDITTFFTPLGPQAPIIPIETSP